MSNFDDDWMHNPVEMDDWINTLEEETKNVPRKSGGGTGGSEPGGKEPGGRNGCLGAVIVVVGIILLIALIATISKSNSPSDSSHKYTITGGAQQSETCAVSGCENKRIFGTGFRYCYQHTCESLGCKDQVVSGSKYCSKHQPPKLDN